MYVVEDTLDDLMDEAFRVLLETPANLHSSRGKIQ